MEESHRPMASRGSGRWLQAAQGLGTAGVQREDEEVGGIEAEDKGVDCDGVRAVSRPFLSFPPKALLTRRLAAARTTCRSSLRTLKRRAPSQSWPTRSARSTACDATARTGPPPSETPTDSETANATSPRRAASDGGQFERTVESFASFFFFSFFPVLTFYLLYEPI